MKHKLVHLLADPDAPGALARAQFDFSAQRLALAVQKLYDGLLSIGPEPIP
jgi:hypothetical protein